MCIRDSLGTGREWDMARRHGGLNIVPPFAEKGVRIYSGRVEADVYKRQAYFIRAAGSVSLALDPDLGAIEGVGGTQAQALVGGRFDKSCACVHSHYLAFILK